MLKLVVAVLALVLASTASAARWKDLRVDASSEAAFERSLAAFKDELSAARRYVLGEALKDIWVKGTLEAEAAQREYTADDYYKQLHGLGYEQIVTLTDPSGDTAKARHRTMLATLAPAPLPRRMPSVGPRPAGGWGSTPESLAQGMQQCHCGAPNGEQGN
ncbi:MAG TPA: hypothetical protein VM692_11980 [Gammaproteobacteria bacterium]|nr:hypothetical protein [Gammaproteobacteria bacterium]